MFLKQEVKSNMPKITENNYKFTFDFYSIVTLVFGDFLPGSREKDQEQNHEVILGVGTKIYCPQHSHAYPVRYRWVTKLNGGPKMIHETRRYIMLNEGKVLFIPQVTKDIVDELNGKGGVRCMMIIKTKPVTSRSTMLKVAGQRKLYHTLFHLLRKV